MTRVTLDLEKLVEGGQLSAGEAERLKGLAEPGRGVSTLIQVLFIIGALGLAGGVMLLKPDAVTGIVLAIAAITFAIFAQRSGREDFLLLGTAMGICGTIGLNGSLGLQFGETLPALAVNAIITAVTLAMAILLSSRFLAALVPLAVAALIGSSTAYWHASYGIIIRESFLTVVIFGAMSAALFAAAPKLQKAASAMATVAARVSWLIMNFGFWVGSLWGDFVGDHFRLDDESYFDELASGRVAIFHIPDWAFILGWVAVSAAVIVFLHRNRFAVNASITFLAINAYTQFFEWFGDSALVMLTGGVALLAFAFGLYHFDKWMTARNRAAAA